MLVKSAPEQKFKQARDTNIYTDHDNFKPNVIVSALGLNRYA